MQEKVTHFEDRNMKAVIRFLVVLTVLGVTWAIYSSTSAFNNIMDISIPPVDGIENKFEIGNLKLTKASIPLGNSKKTVVYVTTKELTYLASTPEQIQTISTNYGFSKMTGLESYLSFVVLDKHKAFWSSQFYLEILFKYVGLTVFMGLLFLFVEINFRQGKKLFTKEVKWIIYGLIFSIYGAYFLGAFLYGRMIHFLNKEFYLVESLTGGLSQELLILATVLLFLIIFVEKGIPIQNDQDLTV